ncbi:hypothetical protein BB561_002501 [Smittium simulii]|uniref:Uncharacterized protein n=1 Tax=Smittium simulii TaxID=133385 RepID=A0A2T9YQA3_9FUNG|nr:hypothetical protein BB561_002501 [Smittium simulii]
MQESKLISIIKNLNEKVEHLYLERQHKNQKANSNDIVPETTFNDPFIKTRMPITELEAYPELLQTIPAIIRNNPGAKPESDDVLEFAEIMRVLISDLASSITQSRVDNLYKTIELPGRAPQLLESANSPLANQKKLDTLLASKKTGKKTRRMGYKKPFQQRQQAKGKENLPNNLRHGAGGGRISLFGTCRRNNKQSISQGNCRERLQDTVQENRNSHTSSKFRHTFPKFTPQLHHNYLTASPNIPLKAPLPQHSVRMSIPLTTNPHRYKQKMIKEANKAITDEVAALIIKNAIEEIKNGSKERQTISIQNPTVWPIVEPVDIYKVAETSNTLGQKFGNRNGCLSGRLNNNRRVQRDLLQEHGSSVQQTYGAWVQDQALKFIPGPFTVNKSFRYDYQHEINDTQGTAHQDKRSEAGGGKINQHQECLNQELSIAHWESPGNVNSPLTWTSNATQAFRTKELFTQGNQRSQNRSIYRRQQSFMGNSDWFRYLFWFIEYYRQAEAHKRNGFDCCLQSLMFTSSGRPLGSSLFGQHYYNGVRQKIWRRNIQTTVRDIGEYMDALFGNKDKTTNSIYPITDKPCGCSQQTYSINGIDTIILQLVQGKTRSSPELSDAQLENLEKSLHLPTIESNFSDFTENIARENNSNNSNSILEIRDMVPNNNKNEVIPDPKSGKSPLSKNKEWKLIAWKVSKFFKTQGLNDYATEILFNNKRRIRPEASKTEKWKSTTIRSYKSALISLLVNPTSITEDPLLKEFLRAVDETSIVSYTRTNIDISPIINQIRSWEKKKGKPIERNCTISARRDKILCPVLTYNIYKLNIARDLCPTLHQNFDAISVNILLRYIKDYNKPLSVDSITRYIHKLSKLIDRPHNTPIPKTRAIGATLAAEAGIPSDQIISHAFWSSSVQLERKSISVLSTEIWPVSQPTYLHQDFAPFIGMGEIKKIKKSQRSEKTKRAGLSGKLIEVTNHFSANNHIFRNGNKFKEYDYQGLTAKIR